MRPLLALRLALFAAIFGALYTTLAQLWSRGLAHAVIDVATVEPAAWLGRIVARDPRIVAAGSRLGAPGATLNVLFGCEGSDALMLLIAAVCVAPCTAARKAIGLVCGAALVFGLNQARLLALLFCLRARPAWFGALHGLLGPLALVACITAFFLLWMRWAQAGAHDGAPAA